MAGEVFEAIVAFILGVFLIFDSFYIKNHDKYTIRGNMVKFGIAFGVICVIIAACILIF